jgi:hypothetical protein
MGGSRSIEGRWINLAALIGARYARDAISLDKASVA